jgi:uncharacterized repeat protein (TIGR02543 family)
MKKFYTISISALLLFFLNIDTYGQTPPDFSLAGYATMTTGTTGGAGGRSITVTTGAELQAAINAKKKETEPLTIYVAGKITYANSGVSKIDIKEVQDVSILGVGTSGEFEGIGIKIFRANNIIVRNLKIHHVRIGEKDCISIEGPASHIWIDHCELFNEYQGVSKDYYDGLLDIKADADYITVSWNYMYNSWKSSLSGSSETDTYNRKVTYHHNYFRNLNSRVPLFRGGSGHIFNNYYKDIAETAINSRIEACIKIENNYFLNAKNPWVSAYSTVVGYGDISGNVLINSPFIYSSDTRELGPCTAIIPYDYSHILLPAEQVPSIVEQYAGVGKLNFGDEVPPVGTFALNTQVLGQGSVTPSTGAFAEGTTVTITATPAEGWDFAGWSGDATGTVNPLSVIMNSNKNLTAVFAQKTSENNSIRITAIDLPDQGLCSFNGTIRVTTNGTSVLNLSNSAGMGVNWKVMTPEAGNYQLRWRYAGGGSAALETAKLIINGVLVMDNVSFPKPKDSQTFLITEPMEVTLDKGVNEIRIEVYGTFADIEWIEISGKSPAVANCSNPAGWMPLWYVINPISTPEEGGSVIMDPGLFQFAEGSLVTLTALAEEGFTFAGWGGDASGTDITITITVDADKEVIAHFEPITLVYHQLSISVKGEGSVAPGEGTFEAGGNVSLLATAAQGWIFSGWSGDAEGSENPLQVMMNNDKNIIATFIVDPATAAETTLQKQEWHRVYPNPSGGMTTFEIQLPHAGHLRINLFSSSGVMIETITSGLMEAGITHFNYSNPSLKPGIYFYTIETGGRLNRGKLIIK